MINRIIVHEALKSSLSPEISPGQKSGKPAFLHDRFISLLIHDIFGGEILKTRIRRRWHFYNRIDGERIDFSMSKMGKCRADEGLEDIPLTHDDKCNYVDQADYSTFFMRFVRAFEETVGLDKNYPGLAT